MEYCPLAHCADGSPRGSIGDPIASICIVFVTAIGEGGPAWTVFATPLDGFRQTVACVRVGAAVVAHNGDTDWRGGANLRTSDGGRRRREVLMGWADAG